MKEKTPEAAVQSGAGAVKPHPSSLRPAFDAAVATLGVGLLAAFANAPALAPPLGASAFILFVHPEAKPAAPRNMLLAHALGIGFGLVGLHLCGVGASTGAFAGPFCFGHAAAAAIAIFLTTAAMIRFDLVHPPADATTLVVSLGLLRSPSQLAALGGGAIAMALLATFLHRTRGTPYPLWRRS